MAAPATVAAVLRTSLLALAAIVTLAGCGSGGSVPRKNLEHEISVDLAAQVHAPAPAISCPKDLPGKVGSVEQCILTSGTTRLPVSVTVDKVSGSRVHFNIQVGRTALP